MRSTREKFLPIMLALFACGCAPDARNLRLEIINASNKSITEKISLDVSNFLGKKIKKICVQDNEYMVKEWFVDLTKMDAPGFQDITGGEFVLWMYLESGSPIQVKLKKSEVIPLKNGNICTESAVLYFAQKAIVFN